MEKTKIPDKAFFKNKQNILFLVLLLYALATSIITSLDGGDFDVYLEAAQKLSTKENIYAPPFIRGLQYYYSVFFALILIPFSFTTFISEVIWSLLSYFFLYRIFTLIKTYFDFTLLTTKQYRTWVILTLILSLQFILYNVAMIQITFFLLWAIFESLNLISKRKNSLAGILLGLAINIKLMPIIMLAYLFYRGHFKALGSTVVTFITLLFLPSLFIGHDFNLYLLSEWWKIINPANKEHMFETEIGTHSIVAWLPVFLTETTGEMPYKRNLLNLEPDIVSMIVNLVRLLFLAASIFFLKSIPFKKENNKLKSFWEVSYFVMLIPLLLPHQQKYNFILVLPMIMYLLYFFIRTYKTNTQLFHKFIFGSFIAGVIIYTPLYGSDIIGKFLFRYTQHFRILTFCTILLIPIALYCNPKKLTVQYD